MEFRGDYEVELPGGRSLRDVAAETGKDAVTQGNGTNYEMKLKLTILSAGPVQFFARSSAWVKSQRHKLSR